MGGLRQYPVYDGTGTVRRVANEQGGSIFDLDPDAFGYNRGGPASATWHPYRYGGAWDYFTDYLGSGLLQLGHRFYWPEVGRFIQQDPMSLDGNRYPYVSDNPLRFIDPQGLKSLTLGGYLGWGAELTVGKNPCGGWFLQIRAGYGIGAGISYDPRGSSPGWDPRGPRPGTPGLGGFVGGSGNIGGNLGPLSGQLGLGGGGTVSPTGSRSGYGGFSPSGGLTGSWGLGVGASVGIDAGLVHVPSRF